MHNVRRQLSQWNFSKVAISKIILLIQTQFYRFFIAFIAWKGSIAAGLNVFYRVILLKLPHATIKNLMCAMLPDWTVYHLLILPMPREHFWQGYTPEHAEQDQTDTKWLEKNFVFWRESRKAGTPYARSFRRRFFRVWLRCESPSYKYSLTMI